MWFLFASLNPLAEGFRSVVVKKTAKRVDPIIISWSNNFLPSLIFTPFLFFIDLNLNPTALIASTITSAINAVAVVIYIKAISEGDISEVMPMMSLTPIILLLTSPLLLGEFPPAIGLLGILTIVLGSYILNVDLKNKDLFAPFKALVRNKGTRYMLMVASMWGVSANFDKIAINNSSIMQHIIFMNLFIFISITIYLLIKKQLCWNKVEPVKYNLLAVSAFTAGTYIFHMTALSMTFLAYVVAMKRMSGPISVVLGHFLLKEPNIRARLLGSLIMVGGVILILLA
jgi:drug/metabolite transporter (DMT)-like permease